jgi:hypothetical protein
MQARDALGERLQITCIVNMSVMREHSMTHVAGGGVLRCATSRKLSTSHACRIQASVSVICKKFATIDPHLTQKISS